MLRYLCYINKHNFCSTCCRSSWSKIHMCGKNNPNYGNRIKKEVRERKLLDTFIKEIETHYCKCGCNKKIKLKLSHKYYGIPDYIKTHENIGRKQSKEHIKKRIKHGKEHCLYGKTGKDSNGWKGGLTSECQLARNCIKYGEWRTQIFKRDNYTCQITNERSNSDIEAHHFKNFSVNKKERFNINNGVTLKKDVHTLFHKIYGKKNNTKEQYEEFKITIRNN